MASAPRNVPQISDAEWDVMKVVWDHGPLTAGEVVRHLATDRDWSPRTVKTLLSRLVKKGAAGVRIEDAGGTAGGRRFLYEARVSREACVRQESRSFLSRVFDGNAAPALVHLLEESAQQLSEKDLQELRIPVRPADIFGRAGVLARRASGQRQVFVEPRRRQ